MRLIITDTNVLFDVIKVGALPEFFSLDFEICTTVFLIDEIKPSQQREQVETFIRSKQLTVFEFSGEVAEKLGLAVHGSIWVIDELTRNHLISPAKAIELLELLIATNSWLPRNEIEKRINKLK